MRAQQGSSAQRWESHRRICAVIPSDRAKDAAAAKNKRFLPGTNDFGNLGYGGPMPPEGHGPHHYFFMVLALDAPPELPEGLDFYQLLAKVEPNVLGMNRLVGTFNRPRT